MNCIERRVYAIGLDWDLRTGFEKKKYRPQHFKCWLANVRQKRAIEISQHILAFVIPPSLVIVLGQLVKKAG